MQASIFKSEARGRVTAPSSKSYTIRSTICSALAKGESAIIHPLLSDDTLAALDVIRKMGAMVEQQEDTWRISGGNLNNRNTELYCGDSAATLRFMTAVCAAIPGNWKLTAGASLSRRPVKPLVAALNRLGIDCAAEGDYPPVTITGNEVRGGTVQMEGDISSQYISALMLMAPLTAEGLTIELSGTPESLPYILMTRDCMQKYGVTISVSPDVSILEVAKQAYTPIRFIVEGDWSSASYFLALGAMTGMVEVKNLNTESLQGDSKMLDILNDMGAAVIHDKDSITVSRAQMKAVDVDLTDCIDLLPTVAAMAATASGTSRLWGIRRGRIKESDRVAAVAAGLGAMGIEVQQGEDLLSITGSTPKGAVIDSRNDHRIAMAFSLLGCIAGDTVITEAECVSKTFPEYWNAVKSIGVKVAFDE
jgi:3-phosphoshikimate 1-carboxyvinyltransferase